MAWLVTAIQVLAPKAMAADTATGQIQLSGNVPVIFSLTTRGIPGDLDLTPKVAVNDRLLGILHLKYNVNVAHLYMYSDTVSGTPENAGTAYSFGTAFKFKFLACSTVIAANEALFTIDNTTTTVDIADPATAGALTTTGIEEDCSLTASWGGTNSFLPLAGKYSMNVTFTMISI
jgi:hypothetical protein